MKNSTRPALLEASSLGDDSLPAEPNWFSESLPQKEKIRATRGTALLQTSAEAIQRLDAPEVLTLQCILEHGDQFGVWCTPSKFTPTESRASLLRIDLRKRIIDCLPGAQKEFVRSVLATREERSVKTNENIANIQAPLNHVLDLAILMLSRYLVLLRMGPVVLGSGRRSSSLDPSNIMAMAYDVLPALFALAASKLIAEVLLQPEIRRFPVLELDKSFLNRIQMMDLNALTESKRRRALAEIKRMHVLHERGYWNDVPAQWNESVTDVSGAPRAIVGEKNRDSHLPLPDEYVSEMGYRSLWLIQTLAPNLFSIVREIHELWKRTDNGIREPTEVQHRRRKDLEKFLKEYQWIDIEGRPLSGPPFPLRLAQVSETRGRSRDPGCADIPHQTVDWPPLKFAVILGLLNNVQLAHLFVVGLSTGGRRSETLSLERRCVHYSSNGSPFASGLTFKLVKRHEGELRDWVLPDIAAQALEQQVRLVSAVEVIGLQLPSHSGGRHATWGSRAPTHLWAQVSASGNSDRAAPLFNFDKALKSFARSIGMDAEPSGQKLRPHRLRKTVARLVALALTQAPKILMDVFGHKSIEMTLYYILSDKDLRAEIEVVGRELRVMRAREAVEKMHSSECSSIGDPSLGGYGGPAALMVQRAVVVHEERLHRRGLDWGAETSTELAEILTLQGKAWQLVRRGVICTKFSGSESGPCNQSKGHPEPSRCQSHCKHRLEEGFLREDVDNAIRDALKFYVESRDAGEELLQSHWAGQLMSHIVRFEDLRMKWMTNSVVQSLVNTKSIGEN